MNKNLLIFPVMMLLLVFGAAAQSDNLICPGYLAGEYCIIGIEEEMQFDSAKRYCEDLDLGNHNWRLPSGYVMFDLFEDCDVSNCGSWLLSNFSVVGNFTQYYNGIFDDKYWTDDRFQSAGFYRNYVVDLGDGLNVSDSLSGEGKLFFIWTTGAEHYALCVSTTYMDNIHGTVDGFNEDDLPSWIPDVPKENRTAWVILIIIGIVGLVSLSDSRHFLAHAVFGAVAIIAVLLISTFIGFIPWWISIIIFVLIIGIVLLLKGHGGRE